MTDLTPLTEIAKKAALQALSARLTPELAALVFEGIEIGVGALYQLFKPEHLEHAMKEGSKATLTVDWSE